MKSQSKILTTQIMIASTVAISIIAPAQPASAQILELATGALSILNSITGSSNNQAQPQQAQPQQAPPVVIPQQRLPQPQNPKFNVGTGNLNGNTLNLCISGCVPQGTQTLPARTNPVHTLPPGVVVQPR